MSCAELRTRSLFSGQNRGLRKLLQISLSLLLLSLQPLFGYAVLSHEELIDISWDSDIKPALLKRFPEATPEELKAAHAYAYGGSVIQDLGYYPLGNHEFTNLLHYVRSGAFVGNMLRDAQTLNEFAFALGALSHYAADTWGHPAVNAGVALEYPKLRTRFGKLVTYEDDPDAHLKTEFSFDALQVAKHRYESKQYHDFIGFKVSEDLLERAFQDTYGFPMDDMLHFDDLTLGTYRFAVSQVIPEMTKVAVVLASHRDASLPERPDAARRVFLFHLSRADYEKQFGRTYQRPGVFARIIAFILRIIGRFGPFRALAYKDPTPQTEDLYFRSFDNVVSEYHRLVQRVNTGDLNFPNRNLDTGELTRAGQYELADTTYSAVVRRLAEKRFAHLTPALKSDLLAFFASGKVEVSGMKLRKTEVALASLKLAAPDQANPR